MLCGTFAGITPGAVLPFIAAQLGGALGAVIAVLLYPTLTADAARVPASVTSIS